MNASKQIQPNRSMALMPIALLLGLMATAGCGQISRLDDTQNAIQDMKASTGSLDQKMKEMNSTIDALKSEIGNTNQKLDNTNSNLDSLSSLAVHGIGAAKKGMMAAERRGRLESLGEASDMAEKIAHAKIYFLAFQYQFWSPEAGETQHDRDRLMALAAQEFMYSAHKFYSDGVNETDSFALGNVHKSLNALSVVLHEVDEVQEDVVRKHPEIPRVSMLTMLKDSLLARQELALGVKQLSDYPEYVHEILYFDKLAEFLIQARYNMMVVLALTKTTDINYANFQNWPRWSGLPSIEVAGLNLIGMSTTDWVLELEKANPAKVSIATKMLNEAEKTKTFLEGINIEPQLNDTLATIMTNMKLSRSTKGYLHSVSSFATTDVDTKDKATLANLFKTIQENILSDKSISSARSEKESNDKDLNVDELNSEDDEDSSILKSILNFLGFNQTENKNSNDKEESIESKTDESKTNEGEKKSTTYHLSAPNRI